MSVVEEWWDRGDHLDANLGRLLTLDPTCSQRTWRSQGGYRTVVVTSATLGKPEQSEAFPCANSELIVVRAPHPSRGR